MPRLEGLDGKALERMLGELQRGVVTLSNEDYATARRHLLRLVKKGRLDIYDTLDLDGSSTLFATVLTLNATGFLYLAMAGEAAGTEDEKAYLLRASGVFEMVNAVFDPIMAKDSDLPEGLREGLDRLSDMASDVASELLRQRGLWVGLDFA